MTHRTLVGGARIFSNEQRNRSWSAQVRDPNVSGSRGKENLAPCIPGGVEMVDRGFSATSIKGEWTSEEDL